MSAGLAAALLVAAGAGLGSALRFLTSRWLDREHLPCGTLMVNVTGSFLLGLLVATAAEGHLVALLGAGFCGGLTTYSSFAVQTRRLGRRRGTGYAVVSVLGSLGACGAGLLLAG